MSLTFVISFLAAFAVTVVVLVNWPPIYRKPKPGEVWMYKQKKTRDPWGCESGHKVEVLDVREGWVRYKFAGSTLWTDEHQKMKSFVYCYAPTAPSV